MQECAGDYDSVIGGEKKEWINKFLKIADFKKKLTPQIKKIHCVA